MADAARRPGDLARQSGATSHADDGGHTTGDREHSRVAQSFLLGEVDGSRNDEGPAWTGPS